MDKEYQLTDEDYTIDDFIEDLKQKLISSQKQGGDGQGEGFALTPKTEKLLREYALKQLQNLRKQLLEIIKLKTLVQDKKVQVNLNLINSGIL